MSSEWLVGPQLGKFQIQAEIGRGSMGAVYLGYDPLLDRHVAIKVLAPYLVWDREFLDRFWREARAAARLKHTSIVIVHDVGHEGSLYYFVMEYLPGETLAEILRRRGALPADEALDILRPLASALEYAHHQGLVHRDVKPGNVIISPDGQVTLTDFGIAQAAQMGRLTSTGTIVGTPEYMSPEQAQGLPVDTRSDQFSLAIVAYHMLTGRAPFHAETSLATLYQIVNYPTPQLTRQRPDLPAAAEAVLEQALVKAPDERYPTVSAFVEALAQAVGGASDVPGGELSSPVTGRPPDPVPSMPPLRSTRRRRWVWPAVGGALVVIVALLLAAMAYGLLPAISGLPRLMDSRLAFVSDRDGNPEIYVLEQKGQSVTRLTHHASQDVDPTWSPDKTRIAFASDRDGNWEIYWINVDGSGLTQLTNHPASDIQPAWSPDGQYIAFASTRDGKLEIYAAGPQGVMRITHTPGDAYSWEPAWVFDGTLLFTSNRAGKREIYRTTTSGDVERMTYTPGDDESWSPAWGGGGNYLAFVSNRDGKREVYYLPQDGIARRLTRTLDDQESWDPAVGLLGQHIAFTSNRGGGEDIFATAEEGITQLTGSPDGGNSWSPAW